MAKQVLECFQKVLALHGGLQGGEQTANEFLKEMQLRGRYVQDIWS